MQKIYYKYLIVNGKCSHLHGHGHYVYSTVYETGLELFVQVYKLLCPAGERRENTTCKC